MAEEIIQEKPKKRKRHHYALWIILGFLVVLITPIFVLYGLVYDKTKNTRTYDALTIEEVGTHAFIDGLNGLTNDGQINVGISKNDVNGLLAGVMTQDQFKNIDALKNIYILMDSNDTITLYIEAAVPMLESRLAINTTIIDDTDAFKLHINDIKLGRLGISKSLAKNIFTLVGIDGEDGISKMGDFIFDLNTWDITLSKDVIFNAFKKGAGNSELITSILQTIQDNNLIYFDVNTTNLIDMVVDLTPLHANAEYLTNDASHLIINRPDSVYAQMGVDQIHAEISSKMNKIVDNADYIEKAQLQDLFTFLFKGYETCNETVKNTVKLIDEYNPGLFRSAGIPDVAQYHSYGDELKSDVVSLLGNAKAQINSGDLSSKQKEVCRIYEKDINNYLRGQGIIGTCGVISFETIYGLEYSYFVVDNFYTNIVNGHLNFVVGVNVSGYETYIILDMLAGSNVDGNVYFGLDKLYFGEIEATQTLSNTVFDMLEKNLHGDEMLGVNNEGGNMKFYFNLQDIANRVNEVPGFESIKASDIMINTVGDGVTDEGCLVIKI